MKVLVVSDRSERTKKEKKQGLKGKKKKGKEMKGNYVEKFFSFTFIYINWLRYRQISTIFNNFLYLCIKY